MAKNASTSITIKSVPKAKPGDQPRVQIDDKVFTFQALQQVLQHAATAAEGTDYAVTVNALPSDADTTGTAAS